MVHIFDTPQKGSWHELPQDRRTPQYTSSPWSTTLSGQIVASASSAALRKSLSCRFSRGDSFITFLFLADINWSSYASDQLDSFRNSTSILVAAGLVRPSARFAPLWTQRAAVLLECVLRACANSSKAVRFSLQLSWLGPGHKRVAQALRIHYHRARAWNESYHQPWSG